MPEKFAVLDFEYQTYQTALPAHPEIYEIGCKLNTGEKFHQLVYGVQVESAETQLTGITMQSLEMSGVPPGVAFKELLHFIKGVPVFIWGFSDVTLLSMTLWQLRIPYPRNDFFDARSYLQGLTGIKLPRGLTEACKHLHLRRVDSHGALVDAEDTLRLINAVAGLKEAAATEVPFEILEV